MAVKLADEVLYDVRLIERHIAKGMVDRKDYAKWLKEQDDLTEHAAVADYEQLTATGAVKSRLKIQG
jgi:hypothetical protein